MPVNTRTNISRTPSTPSGKTVGGRGSTTPAKRMGFSAEPLVAVRMKPKSAPTKSSTKRGK